MDGYLAGLSTEQINEETRNIDTCSTEEMVRMINRQDALVAGAVLLWLLPCCWWLRWAAP